MNAEIQKELDTLVEERMSFAKAARSEAMKQLKKCQMRSCD
jgi:hypothetical protein